MFDRHNVARTLHRYINDDAEAFRGAFASVMASPSLVELQPERANPETGEIELARYSTREMVELETGMAVSAERLAEKRRAIEHITGPERISAVVAWKVHDAGELAYRQLENRLSRSGAKETTLDYTRDFAERRGIAEQMGVRSEIEIPGDHAAGLRAGRESTAGDPRSGDALDRRSSQKVGADLGQDLRADPREDLAQDRGGDRQQTAETPRRGMFDGLKLNARSQPSQDRSEASGGPVMGEGLASAPAQDRWLWGAGAADLAAGVLLTLFAPRVLPGSVDMAVASTAMNADRWTVGSALMQSGDPKGWCGVVDASNLVRANAAGLTSCAEAAVLAKKDQSCTITVPASAQQ